MAEVAWLIAEMILSSFRFSGLGVSSKAKGMTRIARDMVGQIHHKTRERTSQYYGRHEIDDRVLRSRSQCNAKPDRECPAHDSDFTKFLRPSCAVRLDRVVHRTPRHEHAQAVERTLEEIEQKGLAAILRPKHPFVVVRTVINAMVLAVDCGGFLAGCRKPECRSLRMCSPISI